MMMILLRPGTGGRERFLRAGENAPGRNDR